MIRQVGSIDLATGELIEGFPVWVGVKSSPYGNRWFMTNQDALQAIAQDKDLTTEPYRVLMILLGKLDFELRKKVYCCAVQKLEEVTATGLTPIMAGKARAISYKMRDSN